MSQYKFDTIASYYAAWNKDTPTVHLRTDNATTALCGFEITDLTNVAYEPIGASVDTPNLNSLCAKCANIAQFDKTIYSHRFELSEYALQKNDIKEPILINGKRCDYLSELDGNLRKKLFDVRVRKRVKHCAKKTK